MKNSDAPVMVFNANEKYYKIFIFRQKNPTENSLEYRLLTKEVVNGTLEMAGYNLVIIDGDPVQVQIVEATDITKDKLNSIIEQILDLTKTQREDMREIDLSGIETYALQMKYLEELSGINEETLV